MWNLSTTPGLRYRPTVLWPWWAFLAIRFLQAIWAVCMLCVWIMYVFLHCSIKLGVKIAEVCQTRREPRGNDAQ